MLEASTPQPLVTRRLGSYSTPNEILDHPLAQVPLAGAYESDAAEPGSQLGHQLMLVSSTYTLARECRLEVTVTMECAKTFKASLAAACPGSCPRSSDLWIDLDGSLVRSVKRFDRY